MNSNFLNGFAHELTKTAGHPLFTSSAGAGTLLGKKVGGMVTRALEASKKPRLKKVAEKASARFRAGANNLSPTELRVLDQASKSSKYGGGLGNFEGKTAPKFTDKYNPTDVPQAFGKKK